MNSVSTPTSQAYDSLAIVKMSHPEKKTFFVQKMFILAVSKWKFYLNDTDWKRK